MPVENDVSNNVTAYYHLVLSEGRLGTILIEDIFQRACRVGEHAQGYNARAGFWLPGNFLVQRGEDPIPEATFICGSIGLYPDITTLSFKVTIPAGFDQWKKQVHVFIRRGIRVSRFLELGKGPSDNFCDLVFYLLTSSKRVPEALIDVAQLSFSAQFLEANGLTCNCYLAVAQNYSDLITKWSSYFLLTPSNRIGKQGLRPLLPTNSDGTIKTTAVSIEYTFDEDLILPGSFSIEYNSYADRQPFTAQMIWRQELGDEAAIIRTLEVSAPGVSENGPFESYDLSEFCTSENHAAKVGAYIVADRLFSSHVISFAVKPQAHQTLVRVGSIVRVLLTRLEPGGQPSRFDYLYQVQRIYKNFAGGTQYDCKHFPANNERQSLTALAVAEAEGTGILLSTPKTGVTCDTNTGAGPIGFEITVPLDFVIDDFDFDIGVFDPDDFSPDDNINIIIPDGIVFDPDTEEYIWVDPEPPIIDGWVFDPDRDEFVWDEDEPPVDYDPSIEGSVIVFDPDTEEYIWVDPEPPIIDGWVFDPDRDEFVWDEDEPPVDYDPSIEGSVNDPDSGSGPAIDADDSGIDISGGDIGDFGGGGGGSFGGEGEGFGEPEPNPDDDFPQPIEDGPFIPPPNPEENPTPFDPTQPLAPGGPNTPITIPSKPSPSDPNVAQVRVFRVEVAFKSASSQTICETGQSASGTDETVFSFKLTGVAISVSGNFAQTSSGCDGSSQSPVPGINWVVVNANGSTTTGATSTFSIFTFLGRTGSVTGVQYVTGIFDETNNDVPEFIALGLPPVYLEQLETQRPLL
jgi:hypothetical protein